MSTDNEHKTNGVTSSRKIRTTRKNSNAMTSSESSTPKNYRTRHSNQSPLEFPDEDPEEAAAMILSRIDLESYEKAVVFDAENILQRHLLPKSFIWNKPRAQLLRTLPRDIEDMHGILNAGTISPFPFAGPLGFGMFDQGGLRLCDMKGAKDDTISTARHTVIPRETGSPMTPSRRRAIESRSDELDSDGWEYPLQCSPNYEAAARRSNDPGIIEIAVKLPPLKLETALLNCQRHHLLPQDPWLNHDAESIKKVKALIAAERAEFSSSMPFYLESVDRKSCAQPLGTFIDDTKISENSENSYQTCLDDVGIMTKDKEIIYRIYKQRQARKMKSSKIAKSCFRKWRLSTRVGGVSSRNTLINIQSTSPKPMHLIASFPNYIQSGKSVSLDVAQKNDEASNFYLGSYDCRASAAHASMSYQAMQKGKKENSNKKINTGRTRLIWSSFHQAANNKIVFSSDLTGEKLDTVSSKRPLQAQVFVRLNGSIVSIPKSLKSKTENKGKDESDSPPWHSKDVNDAIEENCLKNVKDNDDKKDELKSKTNNAFCTLDPELYVQDLAKKLKPAITATAKKRKSQDGHTSSEFPAPEILMFKHDAESLKYTPATLNCLPLDDGYFRVVCEKPGEIQATPTTVHKLLTIASKSTGPKPICSVCWSDNGKTEVTSCLDCGLNVHISCCADKGEQIHDIPSTTCTGPTLWRCAVCKFAPTIEEEAQDNDSITNGNDNYDEEQIITKNPSRKSRRTSRLPARFIEANTLLRQTCTSNQENGNGNISTMKTSRPCPSCVYCPYSGGAMSPLHGTTKNNNEKKMWAHEVCRIWRTKRTNQALSFTVDATLSTTIAKKKSPLKDKESNHVDEGLDLDMKRQPVRQICCLCGHGESAKNKDEKHQSLMKCAAIGCHTMFHPMCAVLVSKLRLLEKSKQQNNIDIKDPIQEDIELCDYYTLDLLEVIHEKEEENNQEKEKTDSLFMVRSGGKDVEKSIQSSIVPIGLCGIHNPKREKSFYGCTPGAKTIAEYMRIPYQT